MSNSSCTWGPRTFALSRSGSESAALVSPNAKKEAAGGVVFFFGFFFSLFFTKSFFVPGVRYEPDVSEGLIFILVRAYQWKAKREKQFQVQTGGLHWQTFRLVGHDSNERCFISLEWQLQARHINWWCSSMQIFQKSYFFHSDIEHDKQIAQVGTFYFLLEMQISCEH